MRFLPILAVSIPFLLSLEIKSPTDIIFCAFDKPEVLESVRQCFNCFKTTRRLQVSLACSTFSSFLSHERLGSSKLPTFSFMMSPKSASQHSSFFSCSYDSLEVSPFTSGFTSVPGMLGVVPACEVCFDFETGLTVHSWLPTVNFPFSNTSCASVKKTKQNKTIHSQIL